MTVAGLCDFSLLAGNYTYEVTADGCKPIAATDFVVEATEKTIKVEMEATTETPKTKVIFSVKKDGAPLAAAKVVVKDKATAQEVVNGTTAETGTVEFMLAAATYTYEVSANGCKPIAATEFVVDATEKTIEVVMEATTETPKTKVIFLVKKAGTPLASAKVVVKDKATAQEVVNGTTAETGTVEFMLAAATYTYEVTAAGCKPIAATEFVVDATEKTIEVVMEAAAAVDDALFASVIVAPNPFTTQLRMVCNGTTGRYDLLNAQGIVVRRGNMDGNEVVLETSDLTSGLYLLRLTAESGATKTMTIVKER